MSVGQTEWPSGLPQLGRPRALQRVGRATLSLSQVWVLVALVGIFIVLSLWVIRPHDFWWHIRAGQRILESGQILRVDLFSFTRAGEPWAYQSWLMEAVLYVLFQAGGLPLVVLFHALVVTSAYALLLRLNRLAGGVDLRWAALSTLAAAAVGVASWNVRPQTISFLLFAVTLYVLERCEQNRFSGPLVGTVKPEGLSAFRSSRLLWVLPPLFALWANAHGGFVFGLTLVGSYVLARLVGWLRHGERLPQSLILVSGVSGAATLLSPLGLGMVEYVLGFLRHPVTQTFNMEFMPPSIRTLDGQLFFVFLAILITLLAQSGYRPSRHESIRLLLFGTMALMARRNIVWLGFAATPTLAASLRCWVARRGPARVETEERVGINWALAAVVALLALLSLPWFRPSLPLPAWRRSFVSPETPVGAVAFVRDLPQPGRVFHEVGYGSYMIWAAPEVPVFIDTRVELYPPQQWEEYIALSQARYDWQGILDRYGVDTLVLDRANQAPLVQAATEDSGWEACYEDERTVVFRGAGAP